MHKSFALYSSPTQITPYHCPVRCFVKGNTYTIFVRAEIINEHYSGALGKEKPIDGETFLNTVSADDRRDDDEF